MIDSLNSLIPDDKIGENGIFNILAELNGEELTNKEKDNVLSIIDMKKDHEGYYLDAFDQRISYNGLRQLKKPYTNFNLSKIHKNEIEYCAKDYKYFRRNYCKILTRKGIERPEPRDYQEKAEDVLVTGNDTLLLFPRQSGKCSHHSTYINIINNETLQEERITVKEFHDRLKEELLNKD